MQVNNGHPVPAMAHASLVSPQLLGEPDIELDPGLHRRAAPRAGAIIPESRTSVPAVDRPGPQGSLQRTLSTLNPKAVGDLVTNLAEDLQGQGRGSTS